MTAVRLAYSKFGPLAAASLPSILIHHGLFGSGTNWKTLANKMASETNRTVYTLDSRNHGSSEHVAQMSFDLMSKDTVEFCRERGLKQVTLMGHSMGGKTAMVTALEQPELVEQLVVIDVAPTSVPGKGDAQDLIDTMKSVDVSRLRSRRDADEMFKNEITDTRLRNFLLTNLVNNSEDGQLRWKVNLDAIESNLSDIKAFPQFDEKTYPGPSLFLGGGNSNYISPKDVPEIKRLFPNARISHIPEAGHWLHFEKPTDFLKAVVQFINSSTS